MQVSFLLIFLCYFAYFIFNVSSRLPDKIDKKLFDDKKITNQHNVSQNLGNYIMRSLNSSSSKHLHKIINVVKREFQNNDSFEPEKLVEEFIHDPFVLNDFNVYEDGTFTTLKGNFSKVKLHGLKNMKIKTMKFNIGLMQMNSIMHITNIHIEGHYDLKGKMTFFPLSGNGLFNMNITNIEFYVDALLSRPENKTLQVSELILNIEPENIIINFDNLGGRQWSSFYNNIINHLSVLIFDQIKHGLLDEVQVDIKNYLNMEIRKLHYDIIHQHSAHVLDLIIERAKNGFKKIGLEPFDLPTFSERFFSDLIFMKLQGVMEIYHGRLYGLSTLIRTGDVIIEYKNNSIIFEANLGFENLTGTYDWKINLMDKGPDGSFSLFLSSISSYIKLKQPLKKNSKLILDDFKITNIRHFWVEVNGLGDWDFIFEVIFNMISNAFKSAMSRVISSSVKYGIQHGIDEFSASELKII